MTAAIGMMYNVHDVVCMDSGIHLFMKSTVMQKWQPPWSFLRTVGKDLNSPDFQLPEDDSHF